MVADRMRMDGKNTAKSWEARNKGEGEKFLASLRRECQVDHSPISRLISRLHAYPLLAYFSPTFRIHFSPLSRLRALSAAALAALFTRQHARYSLFAAASSPPRPRLQSCGREKGLNQSAGEGVRPHESAPESGRQCR